VCAGIVYPSLFYGKGKVENPGVDLILNARPVMDWSCRAYLLTSAPGGKNIYDYKELIFAPRCHLRHAAVVI